MPLIEVPVTEWATVGRRENESLLRRVLSDVLTKHLGEEAGDANRADSSRLRRAEVQVAADLAPRSSDRDRTTHEVEPVDLQRDEFTSPQTRVRRGVYERSIPVTDLGSKDVHLLGREEVHLLALALAGKRDTHAGTLGDHLVEHGLAEHLGESAVGCPHGAWSEGVPCELRHERPHVARTDRRDRAIREERDDVPIEPRLYVDPGTSRDIRFRCEPLIGVAAERDLSCQGVYP